MLCAPAVPRLSPRPLAHRVEPLRVRHHGQVSPVWRAEARDAARGAVGVEWVRLCRRARVVDVVQGDEAARHDG